MDRPVRVTGVKRAHPAIRRLARAAIALARYQREQAQPPNPPAATDPTKLTKRPTDNKEVPRHA